MAKITLEEFSAFLKQHKDVCVTYRASSVLNHDATFRYQLDEHGMIIEVYTFNQTAYGVCNINDERGMADNFLMSLNYAVNIQPTSSEDIAKFRGVL